jgi:hypothetical protein
MAAVSFLVGVFAAPRALLRVLRRLPAEIKSILVTGTRIDRHHIA